jgi:branched-chain amino acid transport system substrate-binding protein
MRRPRTRAPRPVAALVALALAAAACSGGAEDLDVSSDLDPIEIDDSIGVVRVAPGERIQLRSIVDAVDGDAGAGDPELSALVDVALRVALEDFGGIQGFRVELTDAIGASCDAQGGIAAAETILEDPTVVGVFGPSCLESLITSLAPLSTAGLVVLSATMTAPELTQSPFGERGVNAAPGFHRTAPNALAEASAAAAFAFTQLGLQRAVTFEDGSARAAGLTATFRSEFESLGGTVVRSSILPPDAMTQEELDAIAAAEPDLLFLPLGASRLLDIVEQWTETDGGSETVQIATSLGLELEVIDDPRSEGLYLTGPWLDVTGAQSAVTGSGAAQALERVESTLGITGVEGWWAHAYDAMTLLLRAIEDASLIDRDGSLVISRADLRRALRAPGFIGMTGQVECDGFGDCGSRRSLVRLREEGTYGDLSELPQVFDSRD